MYWLRAFQRIINLAKNITAAKMYFNFNMFTSGTPHASCVYAPHTHMVYIFVYNLTIFIQYFFPLKRPNLLV